MSFVELKARYRAHNYLFCKQSFGHGFVFILKVEKENFKFRPKMIVAKFKNCNAQNEWADKKSVKNELLIVY